MKSVSVFQYSKNEEIINWTSHSIGIVFGFFALVSLLVKSSPHFALDLTIGHIVYGLSFIALFTASTCYHFTKDSARKAALKKLDHVCIYIYIAGCYTPFVLHHYQGSGKFWFLAFVWMLASLGVMYKLFSKSKNIFISVGTYLGLGYSCFAVKDTLLDNLSPESFQWLLYGGICYTIGVLFYIQKKMPFHHALWHIFVLGGTTMHYFSLRMSF
ncbi:MAG: hemolysin III family protein [Bacteriovoracaceae bacterium]|nr:hemolysin III family protein [Bacteriovoracaceae bacterium]